mgnify:CR=1 FL=1
MGLPKKLTEQQMKFAYELVTNEGRKTATECAVDAGFAKDSARQYASKLQNPKLYPLVVKYIGELREEWQKKYEVTYERHISELAKIRAGKANPIMLKGVSVEYYGNMTPLNQVASVSTPNAHTISIQPWEKVMLEEIEKSIINSNLGLNPVNNGESLLINIPPLTEERRVELTKLAKSESESAKVSIRNSRKDANNKIKALDISEDLKSNLEIDSQDLTDKYIKKVDEMFTLKEKDILTL